MSDGGYTFHLGMHFVKYMPYLDEVCAELRTSRPRLIAAVMQRIFEDHMLEELGKKAMPALPAFKKFGGHIAKNVGGRPKKLRSVGVAVDEEEPKPVVKRVAPLPVVLHPLQVRKTTSEPLPESRPHYYTQRPQYFPTRAKEKTKTQLREELRVAVENTSQMRAESHE